MKLLDLNHIVKSIKILALTALYIHKKIFNTELLAKIFSNILGRFIYICLVKQTGDTICPSFQRKKSNVHKSCYISGLSENSNLLSFWPGFSLNQSPTNCYWLPTTANPLNTWKTEIHNWYILPSKDLKLSAEMKWYNKGKNIIRIF